MALFPSMDFQNGEWLRGRFERGDVEPWPARTNPDLSRRLMRDLDSDTGNVLLTLARIWTTVATGDILAKDAAADWALARLPDEHRAVLARARAVYLGTEEDRCEDLEPRVRPHADHVVGEIERLAAALHWRAPCGVV